MVITTHQLVIFGIIAGGGVGLFVALLIVVALLLRDKQRARHERDAMEQQLQEKTHKLLSSIRDDKDGLLKDVLNTVKHSLYELDLLSKTYHKKHEFMHRAAELVTLIRNGLVRKHQEYDQQLSGIKDEERKLKKIKQKLTTRLESESRYSRDELRAELAELVQQDVIREQEGFIQKAQQEAKRIAKDKSVDILLTAMHRCVGDVVTFHSSSVVQLPSEDVKGKIIGRDGRNIKALEIATGMEFVIGDMPEAITISGFNPVRREIARRTLTTLIDDGRINPTRIEEVAEHWTKEIDQEIVRYGQKAVKEFELDDVHPELIKLLGKLHFRTSYTQNVLEHSKEVAYLARLVAAELGLDEKRAARCGLLHDIGKAVTGEIEGPHAAVGARLARKYGEDDVVVNAIAAHHEEVPYESSFGPLTTICDAISASRPGARRETLAAYIQRIQNLEDIAKEFYGVKKCYAFSAGRELRIIVDDTHVSDQNAAILARDIARKIEDDMNFPGQIKVHVVREHRVIEYAK